MARYRWKFRMRNCYRPKLPPVGLPDDLYFARMIGYVIRRFRYIRRWSAESVAQRAGLSVQTLRKIERDCSGTRNAWRAIHALGLKVANVIRTAELLMVRERKAAGLPIPFADAHHGRRIPSVVGVP